MREEILAILEHNARISVHDLAAGIIELYRHLVIFGSFLNVFHRPVPEIQVMDPVTDRIVRFYRFRRALFPGGSFPPRGSGPGYIRLLRFIRSGCPRVYGPGPPVRSCPAACGLA